MEFILVLLPLLLKCVVGPSIDSLLETEYKMNQNHFSFREAEEAKWNEHRAQLNALMMWSSIRLVNNIQTAGTQAILYGDNRFDNLERTGSTLSLKSPAELKQLEAQRIGDRVRSNVAESRRVREATNDGFNRWNEQAKQIEQQGKELENYRASNPELWKLTTKDLNYVKANNGLSNIVNSINTGEIDIGNLSPSLRQALEPVIKATTPIEIPDNLHPIVKLETGGYYQIKYKWKENGVTYEVRWHEKTSGAPEGTLPNWRIDRTVHGSSGMERDPVTKEQLPERRTIYEVGIQEENGNITYISEYEWKKALRDKKIGTATQEQLDWIEDGHIEPNEIQ